MKVGDATTRIVVLSDTHLGRPGARARGADALRPLWQGASHLIINGDVAELADDACRVEAARHVLAIQQACERDGVELTLLPGNHDPMINDLRYLRLFDGEVFITHGDALHPAISPWTGHRDQLRRFHEYTRGSLDDAAEDLDATLAAAQYASHFTWEEWHWHPRAHVSRLPWLPASLRARADYASKVARVMWYWHTLPRRAAAFAERFAADCRFFIWGHIHRAGVWRRGGRVLINTGSYEFPSNPRAVVIERGELRVVRVGLSGGRYAFLPRLAACFELNSVRRAAIGAAA